MPIPPWPPPPSRQQGRQRRRPRSDTNPRALRYRAPAGPPHRADQRRRLGTLTRDLTTAAAQADRRRPDHLRAKRATTYYPADGKASRPAPPGRGAARRSSRGGPPPRRPGHLLLHDGGPVPARHDHQRALSRPDAPYRPPTIQKYWRPTWKQFAAEIRAGGPRPDRPRLPAGRRVSACSASTAPSGDLQPRRDGRQVAPAPASATCSPEVQYIVHHAEVLRIARRGRGPWRRSRRCAPRCRSLTTS